MDEFLDNLKYLARHGRLAEFSALCAQYQTLAPSLLPFQ